jgi:single-stranded-DNA-specific exonuclease
MARGYPEADSLAQRLEEKNAERQQLTRQALAAAREDLARQPHELCERLLIVRIAPWASGVMGLVAGKLVEEFGKPVVVLQEGGAEVRGSGRGTAAFPMLNALRANADLLLRYGGHQLAAGFTMRQEDVPLLAARLRRIAAALVEGDVLPVLAIDAVVSPHQLTWSLYEQLQALEPCGAGNPLPLFLCRRLRVYEYRQVGNNHLHLILGRGGRRFPAIVFRRGDLAQYLRRNLEVDVVFHLEANEWNGCRTLQLRVRDLSFEPACQPDLDARAIASSPQ